MNDRIRFLHRIKQFLFFYFVLHLFTFSASKMSPDQEKHVIEFQYDWQVDEKAFNDLRKGSPLISPFFGPTSHPWIKFFMCISIKGDFLPDYVFHLQMSCGENSGWEYQHRITYPTGSMAISNCQVKSNKHNF